MNERLVRRLGSLYPPEWRTRYREEFQSFLEAHPSNVRTSHNRQHSLYDPGPWDTTHWGFKSLPAPASALRDAELLLSPNVEGKVGWVIHSAR